MFQTFDATTHPEQGPPRLAALRGEMAKEGLTGFLVPRADAYQGEYVAPRDERLAWLTGFTGSAGFAAILPDIAGIFVDGRYRVQVKAQTASVYAPVNWPEIALDAWLRDHLQKGRIGFDPWLHTKSEIEALAKTLAGGDISLHPTDNLIDRIWKDRPDPAPGEIRGHPLTLAGEPSSAKRRRLADSLNKAGQAAAVLTLPDSICWLLNIRGRDIARIPIVQAFAILHADARVTLFTDPGKTREASSDHDTEIVPISEFTARLATLPGPVRVDPKTAPLAVSRVLEAAGIEVAWEEDPCILPKACKNAAEIAATTEAHLRDGAAMVEFLAWLDAETPRARLTEIDVVKALEGFRRATNALCDISFDTISGAGPNGAIVHYRVTEKTNRRIGAGELLLVDSGGQYLDGTTDVTRTIAVGTPSADQRACFTRVLRGMIAISMARWPKGLAGRDLDALARIALWQAGQDYDHGTGHGVGTFLNVHEGPQRLSRGSEVPLQPGMILSNEPGYYREGQFGIRIENLVVVAPAPALPDGDARDMLRFDTLTLVPIDRRLIEPDQLSMSERNWLNAYHAEVRQQIGPRVSSDALTWLQIATAAI
ncbi:MAG: aminopeptidase P family protein [Pseudomonadota bacterium]